MGLDLTTFVLEVVNFLVLLWLLTHFLYRPVQAAIAARQQQAEQASRELQEQRASVERERGELQQARAKLDQEREQERQRLSADVAAERSRRLEALKAELEDERAKGQARAAAQREQEARRLDATAARRAQEFTRRFLERLAGPALESAIVSLFVSDLAALDADTRDRLAASSGESPITVATAFAPSAADRQRIGVALTELLGQPHELSWRTDPALIAGVSVRLDAHLLEASLARGLDAFDSAAEVAG
jgi:F-type H+-transporting ATPase subunit b